MSDDQQGQRAGVAGLAGFADLRDAKTRFTEHPNPGTQGAIIPGHRLWKAAPELGERFSTPPVFIRVFASSGPRVHRLDHQRTRPVQAQASAPENRGEIGLKQREVEHHDVEPFAIERRMACRKLLVEQHLEAGTALAARCLDQRPGPVHPNRSDATFGQGTAKPALATSDVEHPPRREADEGMQDRGVGRDAAAGNRMLAHRARPRGGVRLPAPGELPR